jgi:hypothetical protein
MKMLHTTIYQHVVILLYFSAITGWHATKKNAIISQQIVLLHDYDINSYYCILFVGCISDEGRQTPQNVGTLQHVCISLCLLVGIFMVTCFATRDMDKGKVKVKFNLEQTTKAHRGSTGISVLFP